MKDTPKRIYILGSGFSKSFSDNMPTMQDLTERLFRLKGAPEYRRLTEFIHDLYTKSNHLEDFYNIEHIANIIFSKRIFKDFEEQLDYEKLKFELIKFIYREITRQKLDHSKADTLYRFLYECTREPGKPSQDVIFNFNYDLIIETVLKQKARENKESILIEYGLQFERYEPQPSLSQFQDDYHHLEMLKLHGSFNWFRAKGSDSNDIRNIYLVDEEESSFSIHINDIPTYIPMTNVKALFLTGTLYNTLWAKAIDHLNDCDEIVFIGYSFPITDLNNLALFLDYKDKIKYINVHQQTAGTPKLKRLYQLFGEKVVVNEDARNFIEEKILGE